MVKQIAEIKETEYTPVEKIIPEGILFLEKKHHEIILTEKCKHDGCQKFEHCVECKCDRCKKDFDGKDEKTIKFIRKARKVHRYKYEYINTKYIGAQLKLTITCHTHGNFEQVANKHTNGSGCKKCAKNTQLTNEEFAIISNNIHNNKYDYSIVIYKDLHTKVDIICPIHGIFKQRPADHIHSKHGCPDCSKNKKLTTKVFVEKANKVHENKFDYSLVIYKNNTTNIKIICPIHGIFEQMPAVHLNGCGCKECSGHFEYTKDKFTTEAQKIHGSLYDYSLVEYKNNQTKVVIICPVHGKFKQKPIKHLRGNGCKLCCKTKLLTIEEFVGRSKIIHRNKYNYSLSKYVNGYTKTEIICPTHGSFKQTPNAHLRGSGCRKCNQSKGEFKIYWFLTDNNILFINGHKLLDCINPKTNRKLEFDFYIEKYNLCIEYDGKLHYEPWGNNDISKKYTKTLEYNKYKDNIKTQHCLDNKINLLRIPYWDFDKVDELIIVAIKKIKESKTSYVPNLY